MVEEAAKSKGATLVNASDFLLQKLHSYREALNLRGPPYFCCLLGLFQLCQHNSQHNRGWKA